MNWTVNRIAHFQASALGLKDAGKTRLHRVVRNIVVKSVVPSVVDEADSRGTRLLNDEAAATVLLLVPIADLAVDVRGLRDVANSLSQLRLGDGKSHIAHALSAIRVGKVVTLFVEIRRHTETGEIKRVTTLRVKGEEPTGEAAEILDAYKQAFTSTLATIEVPASEILSSFVS